jgi:NadR type nicotinamide-nucleotide adenylyltransferase
MKKPVKIVLTGAESTGKSTISDKLARHFNGVWIPELAREYVLKIDHHYTYDDLETIAWRQIKEEKSITGKKQIIFFDTWLIITKVWFDFVFGKHPAWLDDAIKNANIDLFILCDIDIPWVPDSLRENGGENREKLHQIYQDELKNYGFNYVVVKGEGQDRINNAIELVDQFLNKSSV